MNLAITGVQVMSGDVPGMVESSLNMGIAATGEDEIRLGFSVRSQKESYRDHMLQQLKWLGECVSQEKAGFEFEVHGRYPAWDYKRDSLLRDIMSEESRSMESMQAWNAAYCPIRSRDWISFPWALTYWTSTP